VSLIDDDLLDNLGSPLDPSVVGISEVKREPGRNGTPSLSECAKCGLPLPSEGEPYYHPMRKYHVECNPNAKKKAAEKARRITPNPGDPSPKSVTNNFKVEVKATKSKVDDALKDVEEGATYLLGFVPMVLALTGDEVCSKVLSDAVPAIAHQLAQLTKFHPALKKVFVSGEGTGEAMAWIGLAITLSPVIGAVLAHHNLLKGKAAERLSEAASYMGLIAQATNDADEA
jgi:hypothetical protein